MLKNAKQKVLAALLLIAHSICTSHPVIGISDGDTLTVLYNNAPLKIRLANIDAPEKRQPFGHASKQSLAALCFGKEASLKIQSKDRYGRTVAVVDCNGIQANRAQVERGMAWVYRKYNKDPSLPLLEQNAKLQWLGLWQDHNPIPPWEFRRK